MRTTTRIVGAAAAAALGGTLAMTAIPASAATVVSNCPGQAVRRCAGVGHPGGRTFRGWAQIKDMQTDNANYTVWITDVKLQKELSIGHWQTIESSASNNGRFAEYENAGTANWTCPKAKKFIFIRTEATFHWVKAGSSAVTSKVMGSGAYAACG